MLRYYFIFFIALVQFNNIFVDSTEESTEKELSSADYYDDMYPPKSEELSYAYKVVYCEVACLNKQDLSYDTCVLPIYKSVHIINWNWMRVFKKIPYTEGFVRQKFNEDNDIQGLLRCNEEPYPNATILVIDFPEIRRNKPGRTNTSCLKIYHQINEAKLSENPKNCTAFLEE